jgi:hypothetical protein
MKIEWPLWKAFFLFFGLILKGIAVSDSFPYPDIKLYAGILWIAFDGAFLWLLQPPKETISGDGGEQK